MMRFKDLKVGDRFYMFGSEYIKIDDRIYGGRLSERPTNAINLDNNHMVVIGHNMLVKIKSEEVLID